MKDAIELTKALVPLAWPILVAIVSWKLFPTIESIIKLRSFTVKVAGMEVSVQDATEQLGTQIADLQTQVIGLRHELPIEQGEAFDIPLMPNPASTIVSNVQPIVLWVDDKPSNNAFEIARLQEQNVKVLQSISTEMALGIIRDNPSITAIVSDMGRIEDGTFQPQAGTNLLKRIRQDGIDKPFIIYSSFESVKQNKLNILAAGGDGATASPIELLEWLRSKLGLNVGDLPDATLQ